MGNRAVSMVQYKQYNDYNELQVMLVLINYLFQEKTKIKMKHEQNAYTLC